MKHAHAIICTHSLLAETPGVFDSVIINDDLETAYKEFSEYVTCEFCGNDNVHTLVL